MEMVVSLLSPRTETETEPLCSATKTPLRALRYAQERTEVLAMALSIGVSDWIQQNVEMKTNKPTQIMPL
jgi:hypothetical protein